MSGSKSADYFPLLRQIACKELVHLLESTPGRKDLAIEPALLKPLDKIASMSLLQKHGVGKVFHFNGGQPLPWGEQSDRRIYLVKPTLANSNHIVDHVLADQKETTGRKFTVVFVPRRLMKCDLMFEQNGIAGLIDVHEFNWSLLQLEPDVYSLELPEYAQTVLVDKTNAWMHTVAKSLWQIQSLYGPIPVIYRVGPCANDAYVLMEKMFTEFGEPRVSADQPVSHLFLMDRSMDLATVLLTGLTYESMLNDIFGISCGKITFGEEVESKLTKEKPQPGKSRLLSCKDEVFHAVRDKHMTAVFPYLSAKLKNLQAGFQKGHSLKEVSEMKQYVQSELKQLQDHHKSLELHVSATEYVMDKSKGMAERLTHEHNCLLPGGSRGFLPFLQDQFCLQQSDSRVLPLVCLYSLCQGGYSSKDYQMIKREFLHAHGHRHFTTLHSLKKVGLFTEKTPMSSQPGAMNLPHLGGLAIAKNSSEPTLDSSSGASLPSFQHVAKRMHLLPKYETSPDLRTPADMSYVFSGAYTPALCQVVWDTLTLGWNEQELRRAFGDSVSSSKESGCSLGSVRQRTVQVPKLYAKEDSQLRRLLLEHCPSLLTKFSPTWWCPFGSAQTIVRQLFRNKPSLHFQREIFCLEDGGQLALDWIDPPGLTDTNTPLVVLVPGITGSTYEATYLLHVVQEGLKLGYRCVVYNYRGMAGLPLLTPKAYCAAYTDDIAAVLKEVHTRYPSAMKLGIGFSMGGMVLWNYLAKQCGSKDIPLVAAMTVSSPLDSFVATAYLETFWPKTLFNRRITQHLRQVVGPYKSVCEGILDWTSVMSSETVREFDTACIVPMFGYKDWVAYYTDASLWPKVDKIPIPTLCLNAEDDCIAWLQGIPLERVNENGNVVVALTRHGGHTAFMDRFNPNHNGLIEDLFAEYAQLVFGGDKLFNKSQPIT